MIDQYKRSENGASGHKNLSSSGTTTFTTAGDPKGRTIAYIKPIKGAATITAISNITDSDGITSVEFLQGEVVPGDYKSVVVESGEVMAFYNGRYLGD